MKKAVQANLEMMRHVALRLGELRDRFVFLGGAATALLVTDKAVPDVRPTKDVDVIVEVASLESAENRRSWRLNRPKFWPTCTAPVGV